MAERLKAGIDGRQEPTIGDPTAGIVPIGMPAHEAGVRHAEDGVDIEWKVGNVVLNLYEVKHVHEGGGMGFVYRVHHRGWDMDLAVKSPRPECFGSELEKTTFIRECDKWSKFALHLNIAACYYVRTLGGIPRVFAEYVEGGSLRESIQSRRFYEGGKDKALERILDVSIQMAWALQFAHEQGVIHQDFKPGNVLLGTDGTAKLTDFGGGYTIAYCSPEQAQLAALSKAGTAEQPIPQVTQKTDMWSWAVSVLEMFKGEVTWQSGVVAPFALESFVEDRCDDQDIPVIPSPLVGLLRRCFQSNPADRPSDMAEVAELLVQVYRESTSREYARPRSRAIGARPDDLNNRAISLIDAGRLEEAVAILRDVLEQSPYHADATYNLYSLLWRMGKVTDEEVVKQVEAASRINRHNWRAKYVLGLIHMQRGDPKSAIEVLDRVAGEQVEKERLEQLATVARRVGTTAWGAISPGGISHVVFGVLRDAVAYGDEGGRFVTYSLDPLLVSRGAELDRCELPLHGPVVQHPRVDQSVVLGGLEAMAPAANACTSFRPEQVWEERLRERTSGETVRYCPSFQNATVTCLAVGKGGQPVFVGYSDGHILKWSSRDSAGFVHRTVRRGVTEPPWGLSEEAFRGAVLSSQITVKQFKDFMDVCAGAAKNSRGHDAYSLSMRYSSDPAIKIKDTLRDAERGHLRCISDDSLFLDGHWHPRPDPILTPRSYHQIRTEFSQDRTFESGGPDIMHWPNGAITCLAVSPTGVVVGGCADGTVGFWNGAKASLLKAHRRDVSSVIALADGSRFLSAGTDGQILLWDGSKPECLKGIVSKTNVNSVTLVRGGQVVVWGTEDGLLGSWNLETGECAGVYSGHHGAIQSLAAPSGGEWFWSGGEDGTVRMWHTASRRCVRTDRLDGAVRTVCVDESGHWLCATTVRGSCYVRQVYYPNDWICLPVPSRLFSASDLVGAEKTHVTLLAKSEQAAKEGMLGDAVSLCQLAREVRGFERSPEGRSSWANLSRLCTRTGVRVARVVRVIQANVGKVQSLCICRDDDVICRGSNGAMRLWQPMTGKCTGTADTELSNGQLCLSADGRLVVCEFKDGLRLWHLATGKQLWKGTLGEGQRACTIAVDGRIASVSESLFVSSPDDQRARELSWAKGLLSPSADAHFSGNGRFLLCGVPDGALLWDTITAEPVRRFPSDSNRSQICATDISLDGSRVLVGAEHSVYLWDVSAERKVQRFERSNEASALRLSNDGRFFLVRSPGKPLEVWSIGSGRIVIELAGPTVEVECMGWLNDGYHIVTGHADGTLWVWELDWELKPEHPGEWRDAARHMITSFLATQAMKTHWPVVGSPQGKQGAWPGPAWSLAPHWDESGFGRLLLAMQSWGYAVVPVVEVRQELQRMAEEWSRPTLYTASESVNKYLADQQRRK